MPLPISTEAAALATTVRACGRALDGVRLGIAVLIEGVLHPVTEMPPLDDAAWALVLAALEDGVADAPVEGGDHAAVGLVVRGRAVGVLVARRDGLPFDAAEGALLRVIAQRVAAAAENGVLHADLAELLEEYMSPDVADALLADPSRSRLGGEDRDVSVLFADMAGFTRFSERHPPEAVVALLNRYFAVAVPAIVDNGGTVSAFLGDAIMGLFGAPLNQPEHPLLAARAALALRDAVAAISAEQPGMPQLRIGVNTGIATVGNIGSPRRRVFTAIGDTVNVASRLEGIAPPGSIAIGGETHAVVRSFAEVRPMPSVTVKGRATPVDCYELLGLRRGSDELLGSRTVRIDLADVPRRPAT
jgi:class 3 adenylate cyclase